METPQEWIGIGAADDFRGKPLTEAMLAGRHIAVNAIAPGPFPTDMTAFFTERPDAAAAVRKGVPLERFGNGEDMAGLVLCLCGAGGAYISGAIIPLDGGMTAFRTPGIEQGV